MSIKAKCRPNKGIMKKNMETTGMLGFYRDNGKENGNYLKKVLQNKTMISKITLDSRAF